MSSTTNSPPAAGRVYGGLTAEQRRERRREQLVEAGIELFGTRGVQATSVRAVVRESGLIERYFHESFADIEELFIAVLERLRSEIFGETFAAVAAAGEDPALQVRAGLRAFIKATTRDPRYARIKLLEEAGMSHALAAHRRGAMDEMVEFIAARAPLAVKDSKLDPRVIAVGILGAIEEILTRWHHGELDLTLDQFVDHCAALFDGMQLLVAG